MSFPPRPGGDTRNMAWGVGFSSPQRSRRLFYNAIPARERRWKESGMRMPKQTRTQTLDENKRTHWRCLAEAPARPSASAPWCGFSPCEELSSANGRARARASARQGDFRVAGRLPHLHARGRVAGLRHETNAILRLKARRARVARVRATDYRAVKQRMDEVPGRQRVALHALQRGRRCCGRWATTRCRSSSRLLLAQGDQPWWYECLPSASRSRCHRRGRRVQQRRRR